MKISQIKPYEKNAKKHPIKQVRQIAGSIKNFGFNQPVVIDENNVIIVGHGRYEAAKELGLKDVPVIKVKLTEEQASAYRLADNKLNESEWDMKLAIAELKQLSDSMFALTGFDKDLLIEPDAQDDVIPENVPACSKLGDLYELGPHRVLAGDSTQQEAVLRLMDGKKADMVFTDPPYNVGYTGMQNSKQWDEIENDSMSPELFKDFLGKIFSNYFDNSKDEVGVYVCHSDKNHKEFREALESVGFEWRVTIIWVKNSPAFNFAQYKYSHEPIFYCFKKNKIVKWHGDNTNRTVWSSDWDDKKILSWFKNQMKLDKEKANTTVWEAKKQRSKEVSIQQLNR